MLRCQTRVFHSALPADRARERLREAVEPLPRQGPTPLGRSFEGVVDGDSFRIHRIVRGRSSFRPELRGRIEATPGGRARVVVTYRLHPVVVVFMAAWLGFASLAVLIAIREAAATGETKYLAHTGGMFALGLLLPVLGFLPEARLATRFLEEVFDVRATDASPATA